MTADSSSYSRRLWMPPLQLRRVRSGVFISWDSAGSTIMSVERLPAWTPLSFRMAQAVRAL